MAIPAKGGLLSTIPDLYDNFTSTTHDVRNFVIDTTAVIRYRGISRSDLLALCRYGKTRLDVCEKLAPIRPVAQIQAYADLVTPEVTNIAADYTAFKNAMLVSMDWIVNNVPADASYTLTGGPYAIGNTNYQLTIDENLSEFLLYAYTPIQIEDYCLTLDAIVGTIAARE